MRAPRTIFLKNRPGRLFLCFVNRHVPAVIYMYIMKCDGSRLSRYSGEVWI